MHDSTFGKQLSFKEVILLIIAILLFLIAGSIHRSTEKPAVIINKQDSAVNINRNVLKLINLGNKRLIADLLWIQTLLEGDEEHYSKLDLNSWMYHRFMSIADLDPLFYENYLHGGMYLSIVKDDPLGASELYDQGIRNYPDDYKLNYNAGYNLVFELGENEKGLTFLDRIKNDPRAPIFLVSIVEKLRYEITQDPMIPMLFLKESLKQARDESVKTKIRNEIYALKAETDLKCLNQNLSNCSKLDSEGRPYIKSKETWHSARAFKKFRLGRRKK